MRELKLPRQVRKILVLKRRTPPGVRELKRLRDIPFPVRFGRTPPGVRELKREAGNDAHTMAIVAPLPGCVN